MYKYAIIGFGGLGKHHLLNLDKLSKERGDFTLAAVCGTNKENALKKVNINLGEIDISSVDFSNCNFYMGYNELFEKESLDFVIITLPTYLHEDAAITALSKGIDVFCEKPMAISRSSCKKIMETAKANNAKLMIGQCLRFDGAYNLLKHYIDTKEFGNVQRAEFTRYSQLPVWSWDNWLLDPKRSGGCALDMHIHDVDLINWYFGKPKCVESSYVNPNTESKAIFTRYFYDDKMITSGADWSLPQKFPFESRCLVSFETAIAVICNGELAIYTDNETIIPEVNSEHYFVEEMRAFLKYVIDNEISDKTSPESVFDSMDIAFSEIESASKGTKICF